MALVVQNTLTGKKEEFKPQEDGKVKMYVCGITPYDESHIGHARCYIVFDVVRRYLEYKKFKVRYIQNFTDIDDKIIARANKLGVDIKTLVDENIEKYFNVMKKLNVKAADEYPRVTEHIKDIIKTVKTLIEKEYAYEVDGTVYFSVDNFKDYGKLSKRKREDMVAGARVGVDESKKNPLDFALWKKAKPEEPSWDSPWGKGRPGWHIECSVMSTKHLQNDTLDIHGGGRDLIFPHHENEIAQSEAATGKQFCRYWLHNGFVTINEEKMSKSLGNTFSLSDILNKYNPMVLRYFLLTTQYRKPIDFSDNKLEEAKKSLFGLANTVARAKEYPGNIQGKEEDDKSLIEEEEKEYEKAMDDDFNTAEAIGHINKLSKKVNIEMQKINNKINVEKGMNSIIELLSIMGIDLSKIDDKRESKDDNSEINELVYQRDEARKNKDWKKSDEIRDKLKSMGITIEDTPSGARWKK